MELMGRKRFAINYLYTVVLGIALALSSNARVALGDYGSLSLVFFYLLLEFIFLLAGAYVYIPSLMRRCASIGWEKKWWIGLIPLLNFIFVFILLIKAPASNKVS
jgi:hypothetical protein